MSSAPYTLGRVMLSCRKSRANSMFQQSNSVKRLARSDIGPKRLASENMMLPALYSIRPIVQTTGRRSRHQSKGIT